MSQRRRPGEVRDAIIAYLSERAGDASIAEIYKGVTSRLGDQTSASSVRSYLRLNAQAMFGGTRLFEQTGHGRYRLLRSAVRESRATHVDPAAIGDQSE